MPEDAVSAETETETQDVEAAETTESAVEASTADVVDEITEAVENEIVEEIADEATEDEITEDGDEDDSETVSSFESVESAVAEIERLRKENASRRVKSKEITEENEVLNQYLEALANPATRDEALKVLEQAVGVQAPAETATPAVLTDEALDTRVSKLFSEREERLAAAAEQARQALAVEAAKEQLFQQVRELGYQPDAEAGTPEFASHAALWGVVARQPEGQKDITAAHEAVTAYEQSVFDRKLAELKAANSQFPPVPGTGASGSEAGSEDKNAKPASAFDAIKKAEEESRRRAEARAASGQTIA